MKQGLIFFEYKCKEVVLGLICLSLNSDPNQIFVLKCGFTDEKKRKMDVVALFVEIVMEIT